MKHVDPKRELKRFYQASAKEGVEVDVPAFTFLMIDGAGDPNTSEAHAQAVEALFSVSYTAEFMLKKQQGAQAVDCTVMPLEGLWWADDMEAFAANDRGPTIERLHAFIAARPARLAGRHREIYLSDVRRADPAKWKTIIRQPMR